MRPLPDAIHAALAGGAPAKARAWRDRRGVRYLLISNCERSASKSLSMNYPPPALCAICGYEYETPREGNCDSCGAPLKLVSILARTRNFKPQDFAELLDKEGVCIEFLLRLAHQRAS